MKLSLCFLLFFFNLFLRVKPGVDIICLIGSPGNWTYISQNFYYSSIEEKDYTFKEAKEHCSRSGGKLAEPRNKGPFKQSDHIFLITHTVNVVFISFGVFFCASVSAVLLKGLPSNKV